MAFGVVVPGRPLFANFQAVDNTKCITTLSAPWEISELVFFLLPGQQIPINFGALLYFSLPPFEHWNVIGAITNEKPSGIFRMNFAAKEEIIQRGYQEVQLGVAIENIDIIANLDLHGSGVDDRKSFAHKIAMDLFNYMTSFTRQEPSQQENMVVPTNIFHKWIERFEQKYHRDPNFMMK